MKLEKLLNIAGDSCNLEIILMVNYEVCSSDDCTYWEAYISSVVVDDVLLDDERVFVGHDQIYEHLEYLGMIDEDESNIKDVFKRMNVKKKLILYVDK